MKEIDDYKEFIEGRMVTGSGAAAIEVFEALDKRFTALDENKADRRDTRRDIETLSALLRIYSGQEDEMPKPLTRCEGCADFYAMCDKWLHGAIENGRYDCYREKHTCGECARAYRRDDSTRAICGSNYKWLDHSIDHECDSGDFEAIQ